MRAIRAFGRPSSRFQKRGGCIAKWRRPGLRIEFYNFGSPGYGICHPSVGRAQSFSITHSKRWRTSKGLRIGMLKKPLLDLHSNAEWVQDHEYYDDGYWLRQNYSPFGDGAAYPILSAHVAGSPGRRVNRFDGE